MKQPTRNVLIRYCMGDFARAIFNGLITSYLIYVYIPKENSTMPELLLKASLTFAVLRGIGAIVDAFIDLFIASWSDHLKNKHGRRIPFLRAAVFPWVISSALLVLVPFNYPHWFNTLWLGFWMSVYFLSSSFYLVPYGALASEIVTDTKQRMSFYTLSTFFFVIGSAFIYITPLFQNIMMGAGLPELQAWQVTFAAFSILAGIFALVPAFGFNETAYVRAKPSYTPLIASFRRTFKYRNYTILALAYMLMWVAFQFFNTSLLYYITMLIKEPETFATIVMGIAMVIGVASYPLVNKGVERFSKKTMLVFACAMYVLIYGSIVNYQFMVGLLGGKVFSILIGVFIGFPISITNIVPSAAFADLAQVDEIKTGENRAAMFMTARSFIHQLSQSIVVVLIPTILSIGSTNQKATVAGVQVTIVIAAIAITLALVVYCFYEDRSTTLLIDDYNRLKQEED